MKKTFWLVILVLGINYSYAVGPLKKIPVLTYQVNLNDRADDHFKVTLQLKGLKSQNEIYQFASTAPGTYQVMDIGRFVKDFKAFDKKGNELKTEKISTNQWKISDVKKVRKITYRVAETWDTKVDKNRIYWMCGTSIENDHVLINGQGVFGYPTGMQGAKIKIKLDYPEEWKIGTALSKDEEGYYIANNYDHIVDSPLLLGRLTKASTKVAGTDVDIFTYSKTDKIKSEQLMNSMEGMLKSAASFIGKLPVDRYTFLFHFENRSEGAWEHSYSSEYVYKEEEFSPAFGQEMTDVAAHEFFHIVTPLNIHSEIVEKFNFVTPTASEHLWLYEGSTEWASIMMQLRNNMMTLDDYLKRLERKLKIDDHFDKEYSLSKLSLTSYTDEGQQQYGNIYYRGALVAGLLDIRLLELSVGTKGLRDVINELAQKYGPNKAFPEKEFFNIFVQSTYPEIADFFEKYVKNANHLPIKEYYAKLGIDYTEESETGEEKKSLGFNFGSDGTNLILEGVHKDLLDIGLQEKDSFIGYKGESVSLSNAVGIVKKMRELNIGDSYEITVSRNGSPKTLTSKVLKTQKLERHKFKLMGNPSDKQKKLREVWMKNL